MILNNLIRFILSFLSVVYVNKKISEKKDYLIRVNLRNKLSQLKINSKNLKETHKKFNKQLHQLLKKNNIRNFLRESFIQKMFFLHNRIFVFRELLELKNDKKWNFYKKLIKEDHVGNPIRYFLYPESSGNKINHVFHLKVLIDTFNLNLKTEIKNLFEFGSGYGCMAKIFFKMNGSCKITCFDTNLVNLLQYYYLKHSNLDVGFSIKNKIFLTSNIKMIKKQNDLLIANWSLSETPLNFRKKFISYLHDSRYILISFQENFENINNLKYFKKLKIKLSKKFEIKIIKNRFYKGNMFHPQNHYYFLGKKL